MLPPRMPAASRPSRDPLRTTLLLLSGLLLLASGLHFFYRPPASPETRNLIGLLDKDGDSQINPTEYLRVAGEGSGDDLPFALLDLDGSGELEPGEVEVAIRYISPLRASLSFVPRVR